MEAPKKLYISEIIYGTFQYQVPDPDDKTMVEYIRKDAFIRKACKFIREGGMRGNAYIVTEFGEEVIDFLKLAEDFKNYMKGE